MTTADRVTAARAEIARRRSLALAARHHEPPRDEQKIGESLTRYTRIRPPDVAHIAAVTPLSYSLAVLDAADATLDRHAQHSDVGLDDGAWCPADGWDYPCPDLSAVLSIYSSCCGSHTVPRCCDPEDCGPCCENCPTCPAVARMKASAS